MVIINYLLSMYTIMLHIYIICRSFFGTLKMSFSIGHLLVYNSGSPFGAGGVGGGGISVKEA